MTVLATDRHERLHALTELTRLAHIEAEATARGNHKVAREAAKRMREVVSLLGFDPLDYSPERDITSLVINARAQAMMRALPGTTSDLARAAGVRPNFVRAYLLPYVNRGEIVARKTKKTTYWEMAS